MSIIRIAVIGDPHFASAPNGDKHSKLIIPADGKPGGIPIWDGLGKLVKEKGLSADLLLTPGDITTYSDAAALKYGWGELNAFGKLLGAKALIASTGNHDVRSRPKKGPVKKMSDSEDRGPSIVEPLKMLDPTYPVHDYQNSGLDYVQHQIEYFGSTLVCYVNEFVRVLIFNSCNKHSADSFEQEAGAIEDSALKYLDRLLKPTAGQNSKINVILCHHCPIAQSSVDGKNFDFIKNGDRLLARLQQNGPWLLIHGHKHVGNICYGPGAATHRPVIFSAASLGAKTETPDTSEIVKNQIYFIDVEYSAQYNELRGKIQVYEWSNTDAKWAEVVDEKRGLYSGAGFGGEPVSQICTLITSSLAGSTSGDWLELRSRLSALDYLMPADHKKLLELMEKEHRIRVHPDAVSGQYTEWSQDGGAGD